MSRCFDIHILLQIYSNSSGFNSFWLAHSRYLTSYNAHVQSSRSLLLSYQSTLSTLEKLQRTNVYADTFCIGHDGGLATINGLRLGRLPAVQVEWAEINAAWGCTLLLLKTVAMKIGCDISGYKLVPMGSFSRLEKLSVGEKSTVLELYVFLIKRAAISLRLLNLEFT